MKRWWLWLWCGLAAVAWAILTLVTRRKRLPELSRIERHADRAADRAEEAAEAFERDASNEASKPEMSAQRIETAAVSAKAQAATSHQAAMDDTASPWGAW